MTLTQPYIIDTHTFAKHNILLFFIHIKNKTIVGLLRPTHYGTLLSNPLETSLWYMNHRFQIYLYTKPMTYLIPIDLLVGYLLNI